MTDSEHTSNNKGLTKRHLIVKGFQETANDQFHYINVTSVEEFKVRLGSGLTIVFKGQKTEGVFFPSDLSLSFAGQQQPIIFFTNYNMSP